jgi:ubiquinone/menaquinone biosynthesis C-methylase UbiE
MSSPIALQKKNIIRRGLISLHKKFSHYRRVDIISLRLAFYIKNRFPGAQRIRCLDVGCGDVEIADRIGKYQPNTVWNCIDIHDLPDNLKDTEKWKKYMKFDGYNIPFDDKTMDVILFCDVLHHCMDRAPILLREAVRVGKIVIIKDHLEYSFFSRVMLKLLDFVGNWGYGVNLPRKYFNIEIFKEMCLNAGLDIKIMDVGIDLYSHLFPLRFILRPEWQFIAVLELKR